VPSIIKKPVKKTIKLTLDGTKLVIDVSAHNWILPIQWDLLATFVDGVVIRLSYGVTKDKVAAHHISEANRVGIPWVGYHWTDPYWGKVRPADQKAMYLFVVNKYKPSAMFNDLEQYWSDWDAYERQDLQEAYRTRYSEEYLDTFYHEFYTWSKSKLSIPVGNYSGSWFVTKYMPQAAGWVYEENYWDAIYMSDAEVASIYTKYGRPVPNNKMKEIATTAIAGVNPNNRIARQFHSEIEVVGMDEHMDYKLDWNAFYAGAFTRIFGGEFMKVRAVPYVSQLGEDADVYNNDCGPACCSMGLAYKADIVISPNELYKLPGWGAPSIDEGTDSSQLSRIFGLFDVETTIGWSLSVSQIKSFIDLDYPIITLVDYGVLAGAGVTCFTGNFLHWITIVGYKEDSVVVHDPYCKNEEGANRVIPNNVFLSAYRNSCLVVEGEKTMPAITNATVITTSIFNIRSQPSIYSTDIGDLINGEKIYIDKEQVGTDGQGRTWGHITYPKIGWVRNDGYKKDVVPPSSDEKSIRLDELAMLDEYIKARKAILG